MQDNQLFPWSVANERMRPDFRESVARIAVGFAQRADEELRQLALETLGGLRVDGFRSGRHALEKGGRGHRLLASETARKMSHSDGLTTIVICLWAIARADIVEKLRAVAAKRGFKFQGLTSWQEGRYGFSKGPTLDALEKLAIQIASNEDERDSLVLAAFWLSNSATMPDPVPEPALVDRDAGSDSATEIVTASAERSESALQAGELGPTVKETDVGSEVPSLDRLKSRLETAVVDLNSSSSVVSAQILALQQSIGKERSDDVYRHSKDLQAGVSVWQAHAKYAADLISAADSRINSELSSRPDLDSTQQPESAQTDGRSGMLSARLLALLFVIRDIVDYDKTRLTLIGELTAAWTELVRIRADVAVLSGAPLDERVTLSDDLTGVTLSSARSQLDETRSTITEAAARQESLRATVIARIRESLRRLQDLRSSMGGDESETLDVPILDNVDLAHEPSARLGRIELDLNEALTRLSALTQNRQIPRLADAYSAVPNADNLMRLLNRLAVEQRDIEILLLLLGAPDEIASVGIPVATPAIVGLLRAIETISPPQQYLDTLNLFAGDMLIRARPNDPVALSAMCVALIGAHYCCDRKLPSGVLWQLGVDLPKTEMTSWNQLWHAALQDEPLPLLSNEHQDLLAQLELARQECLKAFALDAGKYARVRSVKSSRHVAIMNTALVPKIHERFRTLVQAHDQLSDAGPESVADLVEALRAEADKNRTRLADDAIDELYEHASTAAKIDDSDTFHRRTCLKNLKDCAATVIDFGRLLANYWTEKQCGTKSVSLIQLKHELGHVPELGRYGGFVLEALCDVKRPRQSIDYDAEYCSVNQRDRLEFALLSQASLTGRLPNLTSSLTKTFLRHEEAFPLTLMDLQASPDIDRAAMILLANEAPYQAYLFAKSINLDLQKQLMELKAAKERDAVECMTELMVLGGDSRDADGHLLFGRFTLHKRLLVERIESLHRSREQEGQKLRAHAKEIHLRLVGLQVPLYDARSEMPAEAYRLAQQALNLAIQAIDPSMPQLLDEAEQIADDLDYRINHKSWLISELEHNVDRIEDAVSNPLQPDAGGNFTAQAVKELLEANELRRLGLSPTELTPSEVNTRIELLAYWLSILKLPSHLTKNMTTVQRGVIQSLFRSFATMVQLKHVKAPDGKPVAGDEPLPYVLEELVYPRTSALDTRCVMLALSGGPPTAQTIKDLERLIEERQWLDIGYFVLLFFPGCTPALRKRLESGSSGRGLVVIDERSLISIIRAEADLRFPLGVLRALMLNSKGAASIDVFTINQLVIARTAIFVGRDYVVDKVASSTDNYPLFGGRRIGKSSVLKAIETRLQFREQQTVMHSFEGDLDCSDNASAMKIARMIPGFGKEVKNVDDFKLAMQTYLDADPQRRITLLLDEVDRYINANPRRHALIEVIRALSDQYSGRLRVVFSGFMGLYDCLKGRGPYSPTSDPWQRMRNVLDPLANLRPESAEAIVREGFLNILGWRFEHRAIPQQIVQRTGGHPAFVQFFCKKLQERVSKRGNGVVTVADVTSVFDDDSPQNSFISYVNDTLYMNLKEDPVGYYVVLWLARDSSSASSFTLDQCRQLAKLCKTPIPDDDLRRSLERLTVTGVVSERSSGVYEFSVRDYPSILARLGQTALLDSLEIDIAKKLTGDVK